jgi:hypothetical protein
VASDGIPVFTDQGDDDVSVAGFRTDAGTQACCILDKTLASMELMYAMQTCKAFAKTNNDQDLCSEKVARMRLELPDMTKACCADPLFIAKGTAVTCLHAVVKANEFWNRKVHNMVDKCTGRNDRTWLHALRITPRNFSPAAFPAEIEAKSKVHVVASVTCPAAADLVAGYVKRLHRGVGHLLNIRPNDPPQMLHPDVTPGTRKMLALNVESKIHNWVHKHKGIPAKYLKTGFQKKRSGGGHAANKLTTEILPPMSRIPGVDSSKLDRINHKREAGVFKAKERQSMKQVDYVNNLRHTMAQLKNEMKGKSFTKQVCCARCHHEARR